MLRIRLVLALFSAALAVTPALAGPGFFKRKTDPARAAELIETLKSERDEKKRKKAADELGGVDPRVKPEVIPALIAALQKDPSAAVRAEAAESLGQLGQVPPLAAQALEEAVGGDASPQVRLAAKHSLWEYHLRGYRGAKGPEEAAVQTAEPPIASPPGPRPVGALVPTYRPAPPAPVALLLPPARPVMTFQLPPVVPPSGPRVHRFSFLADLFPNSRLANRPAVDATPPPILNLTDEPPIAKRPAIMLPPFPVATSLVPPPTTTFEPPAALAPLEPDYVPTLPPFHPDLPSVVLPPDATPMPNDPPAPPRIPATLPPIKDPSEKKKE